MAKSSIDESNGAKTPSRKVPSVFKLTNKIMGFFIAHNMAGPLNKTVMVITTRGRKSGKSYTLPIGYLRDKSSVVAFNLGGTSDWYKNVLMNPQVMLQIRGKRVVMRGEPVEGEEGQLQDLEAYKRDQQTTMTRFFKVSPNGTPQELLKARERVRFIRFYPVKREAR